jgi:hypothetical protein
MEKSLAEKISLDEETKEIADTTATESLNTSTMSADSSKELVDE